MNTVRQKLMRKGTTFHAQVSVDHWMLSRHVLFKCNEKKILCSSKKNTYLLGTNIKEDGDVNISKLNELEYLHTFELEKSE